MGMGRVKYQTNAVSVVIPRYKKFDGKFSQYIKKTKNFWFLVQVWAYKLSELAYNSLFLPNVGRESFVLPK